MSETTLAVLVDIEYFFVATATDLGDLSQRLKRHARDLPTLGGHAERVDQLRYALQSVAVKVDTDIHAAVLAAKEAEMKGKEGAA